MPGVFEKLQSNSQPSGTSGAGGGVFSKINQQVKYNNARGAAEADEQWQVAHQWDNDPAALAAVAPPEVKKPKVSIPVLDYINDKVSDVSNLMNRAAASFVNEATLKQSNKYMNNHPDKLVTPIFEENISPADTTAEKAADIFGSVAGFAIPGAGAYSTGGKLAAGVFAKLAPNVPKIVQAIGRGTGAGLAYGAAKEGLDAAVGEEDKSVGERLKGVGADALMFGAGDGVFSALGSGVKAIANKYAGSKIGDALGRLMGRETHPQEQAAQEILALPPGRGEVRYNAAMERSNLTPNESPIMGNGTIRNPEPLGLPEGSYTPPTRLKVAGGNQTLDYVMRQIKPDVEAAIAIPARRDKLITYIEDHLQIPREEIHNMPHADLQDLGQLVRQNISVYDKAVQVASKRGYDLPSLLEGKSPNIAQNVARNSQERIAGVFPGNAPSVARPASFNKQVVSNAAPLREKVGYVRPTDQKVTITPPKRSFAPVEQANRNTVQSTPLRSQRLQGPTDNLKFSQTVRDSQHTAPELINAINERPMVGSRTSDVLNRQQATDLINKHGREGLYGKLMSKKLNFSPSETTAAQMLAKHYSSLGGEENLSKAIDLVSKTAVGGREMGQAIQALSQWNKLDAEGALLVAERQLNRGVKDTAEWQKLTTAQGAPITEAAQRIGTAKETKSLADEVLDIVTNKQSGEALTDAEKATIKQFQDQVKLINEKGKGILSQPKGNKANATIKEVSQIEPKERTRDQVVSFLDAKAEKARQRLAASRNIGFAAVNKGNPVIDYAIIGASHIAKGAVKLSDFTEMMVRDFGESVRPHINEAFTKATNIFRKENGLPTVEELDRVVNKAVKDAKFSQEDAHRLKAWASEIGHMSEEFKKEATQDLQFALKSLGESTLGNKLSTLQTAAMLLNEITLERNIIGNAAQLIAEKISKVATVPIDLALSRLTGEQRTVFFKTMNQEKFWKDFMVGTKAGWKGVSPTGTLDSYGVQANVFGEKNPLKYITKSLGAALQGFDYAFYNQAKGEVLATYAENLGKAQGLSKAEIKAGMKDLILKLDDRIHELADHAGLYATYQDETLLSKGSEMLKRGLNEASTGLISRKLVDMGMPKSLSMEGFGLGDVVNKFAKTPANLIMRGIDYSPIGFIRSAMDIGTFIFKKEKFNQHQASRTLGRAITGTLGLSGMGFILADAGILTGSSSMDKDVRSIQEQSGQGAYKVNWSALERFFTSGFDYEAAKYQKGDKLMDYAWLQPAAISVAMGVNANKAIKDRKEGDDTTGWRVASKAILGGLQSFLENPMVQGINNVIDAGTDIVKKQDPTKLKNIGKGVPASFVPTILNQFRTATDNNQRETFSASLLTEMGNLMANKVPGLSNNLPVSYDSMGNARERIQGGHEGSVAQYLTAFFSPAKLTEYQVSPEAKLVLDLMNQSGDQNVLPRIADRNIKVAQGKNMKDLKVDLNAKEFSQLQQTVGKMVTDKLAAQSSYLSDPNRSLESKVKKVKEILTETGQKARDEIGTQMGYTKKAIR